MRLLAAAERPVDRRRQRRPDRPARRPRCATLAELLGAPVATHRLRQGRLPRDAPAGARRLRHLRTGGGQRRGRRGRLGPGGRHQARPDRHRVREPRPCSTRSARRIIQIDVEPRHAAWTFPVAAGAARRRQGGPGAAPGGRRARRWRRADNGGARGGWRRPTRACGSLRRRGVALGRDADPAAAHDPRAAPGAAGRRDRHLRRRREPAVHDAPLPDQGQHGVSPAGRGRRHGLRHPGRAGREAGPPGPAGRGGLRRRRLRHRA